MPESTPITSPIWPLLRVSGLRKHFGGVRALDGVDFELWAGQCVALIGPNGAGKSTCFAALCGQQKPDSGQVLWLGGLRSEPTSEAISAATSVATTEATTEAISGQGANQTLPSRKQAMPASVAYTGPSRNITGWSASDLAALGIGRTFQVAQVFEALDVLSNVQLAMTASRRHSGFLPLKSQNCDAAHALLAQVGLGQQASAHANALPYGAKKRLELAIALAGKPALLLLDEPAAGLAVPERHALMALVKQLCAGGMAVLYTEHNMDAVFGVADRVLVLIDGCIAAAGSPHDIAGNAVVKSRYLGTHFIEQISPVARVGANTAQDQNA